MKQALEVCKEICKFKKLAKHVANETAKYEFSKHITKLEKELRQYCIFKGFSYYEVWEEYKNRKRTK